METIRPKSMKFLYKKRQTMFFKEQGRIRGNPVADGWAGAVMQKPLGIQKYHGRTDLPTDQHSKV